MRVSERGVWVAGGEGRRDGGDGKFVPPTQIITAGRPVECRLLTMACAGSGYWPLTASPTAGEWAGTGRLLPSPAPALLLPAASHSLPLAAGDCGGTRRFPSDVPGVCCPVPGARLSGGDEAGWLAFSLRSVPSAGIGGPQPRGQHCTEPHHPGFPILPPRAGRSWCTWCVSYHRLRLGCAFQRGAHHAQYA